MEVLRNVFVFKVGFKIWFQFFFLQEYNIGFLILFNNRIFVQVGVWIDIKKIVFRICVVLRLGIFVKVIEIYKYLLNII